MPDFTPFKYRAFLSYSHADTGIAMRVHRRLEGFHIDKELVGRVTATGLIPKVLRPIFRDRNDFDAGSLLGAETGTALDDSAALIVLASPHAARSNYVNEELRLFKTRHPGRPVIPLIVDGTPGDPERECFPLALRFTVAPDGGVTDSPVDVLAADLRENGDGFELALAKVVARLIGLAPDDVYRRSERERRRQGRLRAAVAAVIVALAIVGGGFFWQSHQQKQTLAEISALVDKYSLITPAEAAAPGARASLTRAITTIAEGAATDPRYAKALELLKAGKGAEAEPLLKAVAEDKAKRAEKDAKDAAAAYRNLAAITAISEPGRAREYYAEAARLDPSDIEGMLQNGWFQEQAGQLDAAQAAYKRVIAEAKPGADDGNLVWAKFGIGDIAQQRGDLDAALSAYREAESICNRLATSDPDNAGWQRAQSVSDNKIGDVQAAQGNLSSALTSYRAGLTTADRLASSDPGKAAWQGDLAVSYDKVGDAQATQGDLPGALISYQAGLVIRDHLATSDPGDADGQRDLSVSYNKVGDARMALGNLPAALAAYQAGLAIRDRLAKSDQANASAQRDLSVSYDKAGAAQAATGDLPAALGSFQAGFEISSRLAQSDPGNAGWQRDLAVAYNKVGDVQAAQRNLPAALDSYEASLGIAERLVSSDPGNAGWQRDLSVTYNKVGTVQRAQGNLPAALDAYQASLGIADRLAKADSGNAGWRRDLAVSYANIADVYLKTDQPTQGRAALVAGREIIARLTAEFPDVSQFNRDLAYFDRQIAALKN